MTGCQFGQSLRRRSVLGGRTVSRYASTGLQTVLPSCHDLFAGRQAISNYGGAVTDMAHFKWSCFDSTVGFDDVGVITVWPALQRPGRRGHNILLCARQQPDVK